MRNLTALAGTVLMCVVSLAVGQAQGADESRGKTLYSTYCTECHTTQVHWREKRLATDWASLKFQVRRWQHNIGLDLNEDDVAAVATYLNGLYYHYPAPDAERSGDAGAIPRATAQRQE
jgi:mono/diheme cytochrome c family protein